jgi:hypothetical protein
MLGLPSGLSWSPFSGKELGLAELGTVRVDKNADWDSVDAEARRLLLLLLSKAGFKQNTAAAAGQKMFYKVDVVLIEREYMENWKTRRSLSAEILIFKNETTGGSNEEKTPLAAGKALLSGTKSLSSSKTLYNLLHLALSNAIKALPKT